MASSMMDSDYFKDMFGREAMRAVFSDDARLEAWLETEVALAVAQERLGVIPAGVAEQIKAAARLENFDLPAMKADFDRVGFPILPFVKQLAAACDPEVARWVHYGVTTQDILDTGMVLQARTGLALVEKDVKGILAALAKLADDHRATVMAGRTFQQLAAPVTFGYKAAVWLDEFLRHYERLQEAEERLLTGQCAGGVGTFATLGDKALDVQRLMMDLLKLKTPDITWHTARDSWSELLSLFAMMSATLAKIAGEVVILMRSEVGELSEPFEAGRGASTTLPQKRNPVACEPVIAIAHRIRELSASQMTAMIQEHERGGLGQMHLEWMLFPDAFVLLSGSLKHSLFILENLCVDAGRMRQNLDLDGGLIMSEAVMMGLAPKVGKGKAHHLVYAAAGRAIEQKITLREALLDDPAICEHLTAKEIEALLDPANYTGSAALMTDQVLEKYKKGQQ
ncbi:MAG: adenylosuccinate lyase family protein [Bacteroidales bacterium]|nr:adenylosuccinate lyase family protein [Bacteroidales bacterium]